MKKLNVNQKNSNNVYEKQFAIDDINIKDEIDKAMREEI